MKTSIFYFGVFTAGVLTGMEVDWQSWFWGLAAGVSLVRLVLPILKE